MKELKLMREEELHMRNYEKLEKNYKKNCEIIKETKREYEERKKMSVEDPINIMRKIVMENKEKKKYIKIIKKDDERKRESEEREKMSVEDPIVIKMIQDEKKQREKMNAEYEMTKQKHIQKFIDRKKQKMSRIRKTENPKLPRK